jgi:hypothetical protein
MLYKVEAHTIFRLHVGLGFIKVGILPKENIQQVDFALSVYSETGFNGYRLSQEFKHTFAGADEENPKPVVDFVGPFGSAHTLIKPNKIGVYDSMQFHPVLSSNPALTKYFWVLLVFGASLLAVPSVRDLNKKRAEGQA